MILSKANIFPYYVQTLSKDTSKGELKRGGETKINGSVNFKRVH